MPKLYDELAAWWPLMSAPEESEEEAAFFAETLAESCTRPAHSVLELGSGGGNNASYLKARFEMVLVEPSAGMLAVSRALNPECEHVQGDMRTVRLGRQFDAIFVHDAVAYMTSEADLRLAIETAFAHCKPGGAALFAPDAIRETFRPSTDHGGHDDATRGLRYLSWTWDPDPGGCDVSHRLRLLAAPAATARCGPSTIATWKGCSRAPIGCACCPTPGSSRAPCGSITPAGTGLLRDLCGDETRFLVAQPFRLRPRYTPPRRWSTPSRRRTSRMATSCAGARSGA